MNIELYNIKVEFNPPVKIDFLVIWDDDDDHDDEDDDYYYSKLGIVCVWWH